MELETLGTVTRTVTLPASRADVWHELTDPTALEDWLGLHISGPLKPGSRAHQVEEGVERAVRFATVTEHEVLQWEWSGDAAGDESSTVSITLTEVDGGTSLTVTETRAASASCSVAPAAIDQSVSAWDQRLLGLELRFMSSYSLASV